MILITEGIVAVLLILFGKFIVLFKGNKGSGIFNDADISGRLMIILGIGLLVQSIVFWFIWMV